MVLLERIHRQVRRRMKTTCFQCTKSHQSSFSWPTVWFQTTKKSRTMQTSTWRACGSSMLWMETISTTWRPIVSMFGMGKKTSTLWIKSMVKSAQTWKETQLSFSQRLGPIIRRTDMSSYLLSTFAQICNQSAVPNVKAMLAVSMKYSKT